MASSSDDKPHDVAARVDQYVRLRDEIKRLDTVHKEKLAPYREALAGLDATLLDSLNAVGGDSIRTGFGTVYRTEKKSASVKDMQAFWNYVVATADFDLVDKRANVTGVADFIKDNGSPPPGVNYNIRFTVGVRRK